MYIHNYPHQFVTETMWEMSLQKQRIEEKRGTHTYEAGSRGQDTLQGFLASVLHPGLDASLLSKGCPVQDGPRPPYPRDWQ